MGSLLEARVIAATWSDREGSSVCERIAVDLALLPAAVPARRGFMWVVGLAFLLEIESC